MSSTVLLLPLLGEVGWGPTTVEGPHPNLSPTGEGAKPGSAL
jgi:hypothetical protein